MITYKEIENQIEAERQPQLTINGFRFILDDENDTQRLINIVKDFDIDYFECQKTIQIDNIDENRLNELLAKIKAKNIEFELHIEFNLEFENFTAEDLTMPLELKSKPTIEFDDRQAKLNRQELRDKINIHRQ